MPTLSSAGIGSGLDVNGLVAQLVAAERVPAATRIARAQSSIQLELSAFGQFRSALSGIDASLTALTDAPSLDARTATSQDEDVFTVSASAGAAIGEFAIEVQQLAFGHRLASNTPVSPAGSDVGYGTLDITLGSDNFTVDIDSTAQTLADVRNAINNASDNPGVQATLLNTDAGTVLQLTSDRTGSSSEIQISASGGDGGLTTLVGDLGVAQNFQDAIVEVNGYQVTSASNTLGDVLDGVTINLLEARPGESFNLSVSKDQTAATEAMKSFVQSYNLYVDQADNLGRYDPGSASAGPLNGDSILRNANNQLRQLLSGNFGDNGLSLSDFGIELDVEGRLSLDETQFQDAVAADFEAFRNFLDGDEGFATSLQTATTRYIEDDGVLDGRVESLNSRLDRLEVSEQRLDDRIARIEERYLRQFAALDAVLAQLQQTSSYLSQQLASLPGVANNNGS